MTQINDLTQKTTVVGTDELEIQETGGGDSRKVTALDLVADLLKSGDIVNVTIAGEVASSKSGFNIGIKSDSPDNSAGILLDSGPSFANYLFDYTDGTESNRITFYPAGGMDFGYGASATKAFGFDSSGNVTFECGSTLLVNTGGTLAANFNNSDVTIYRNVTQSRSASGASNILLLQNTATDSAASAYIEVQVAGGSSGDPYVTWHVPGATIFSSGIDNSDNDYFKMGFGGHASSPAWTIRTDRIVHSGTSFADASATSGGSFAAASDGVTTVSATAAATNLLINSTSYVSGITYMQDFRTNGTPRGSIGYNSATGQVFYNVTSDPRAKSEFVPVDSDWAEQAVVDAVENNWLGVYHYVDKDGQYISDPVIGYNAHSLIDNQRGYGGTEGQGPRDLAIGEVYEEAVIGQRPIMIPELDEKGNLTGEMIESDELEDYEIEPEKVVTQAGVDQSKRVPLLEAALYNQIKKNQEQDALIQSLIARVEALENA